VPSRVAQFGYGDALQAKRDGELTAMMQVVGHDAPQNPLARESVVFPLVGQRVGLREVLHPSTCILGYNLRICVAGQDFTRELSRRRAGLRERTSNEDSIQR